MANVTTRPPRLLVPLRNLNPLRAFRKSPKRPKPDADLMTLQEHLIEFRGRLVKSILAIFAGMIVGFILYLLWGIPLASALFIGGVLFANAVVIPSFLKFLVNFSFGFLGNFTVTSNSFLTFFIKISLGMGLIFQLPAALFLLSKIRVVNIDKLRRWRRYAFLICTIVGAVISPTPDPFNMMLVALPMYALYEVGAVASYFALPRSDRGRFWRRPKLAA
ncbi:MAG: twin-arginine translocase subunit TatC [Thermomicrobia bacterium]|nr:twin-arginine translocase subunit TatC [Thermomicrobia bacterium]